MQETARQNGFNSAARAQAEQFLQSIGVSYSPQGDGSLFVPAMLDLSNKGLTALPDLSMVDVGQEFYCDGNQLKDLAGAPRSVEGRMDCSNNGLISLRGAPRQCTDFDCSGNELTSLEGGPEIVSSFFCDDNPLSSLEHAPENFHELQSPFGVFGGWPEIPQEIRLAPETWQRRIDAAVRSVTVLDQPIRVKKALRFKRGRQKMET